MKIQVSVKTRSKIEAVEKKEDGSYLVRVNVPPVDGKANKRAIELLAQHFGVAKSQVQLVSGAKSRSKVFDIRD